MAHPDDPNFYDVLLKAVRRELRRLGVKSTAVGVVEVERAAKKWQDLSEDWEDKENYDFNVLILATGFKELISEISQASVLNGFTPSKETLDPRHGVAYATAGSPSVQAKVKALRLELTDQVTPLFPWLELGYGEARDRAGIWLLGQENDSDLYECELVMQLVTPAWRSLSSHVNTLAEAYAQDLQWAQQGRRLTSTFGQRLLDIPPTLPHKVEVNVVFKGQEDEESVPKISVRRLGESLSLPESMYSVVVPLKGRLRDLSRSLSEIALETAWWDVGHALEHVLTGHPPLPSALSPNRKSDQQRHLKALNKQHVALLELIHRLPKAAWSERLAIFNGWSERVDGLRSFMGPNARQAISTDYQRAVKHAYSFAEDVQASESRIALLISAGVYDGR